MIELRNFTRLARKLAGPGKGARIFIKDEAANPSGSFKARRAALSVYHAKKLGYKGVISATSGNYGAAVASQAAMQGLKCIIVQECFDSKGRGQPEIVEKARKCEAFGAEVVQLSVGPELFFVFLQLLEQTGYFNASLYSPFGISGIETLGAEIADVMRAKYGRGPDVVLQQCRRRESDGHCSRTYKEKMQGSDSCGERKSQRTAYGKRQTVQSEVLHHGAHRLRNALCHLSRQIGRSAQCGKTAKVYGQVCDSQSGRSILHHAGFGRA